MIARTFVLATLLACSASFADARIAHASVAHATPTVPLPSALAASAATRSAVTLTWSGADAGAKIAVERKVLGAAWPVPPATFAPTPAMPSPSTITVVDGSTATDSKIDAYTTYVYRVRAVGAANALSAPSNEIIVGPPPVGFSSVLATPKPMQAHDPNQFANLVRMTFDANGDPAIAYVTYDLNLDGEMPDTELSLITWNRAKYKWNAPVSVDVVGNVANSGSRMPFSVARDESTGAFGIFYAVGLHELRMALSQDGGATWKKSTVQSNGPDDEGFSTPALAMANGRAHIAYAIGSSAVTYRTGAETETPDKWARKNAPKLANSAEYRAECVAVVLDATGKAAVSYCMNAASGYNLMASLWKPDAGSTVKIADTDNHQMDDPAIAMTMVGSDIAVAFYANRDDAFFKNHHVWFVRSRDGGATFSAPVVVADDGGNAMGPALSVSIDKASHVAMSAQLAGGSDGANKCGLPKLMRSTDGAVWTTCAPDTKGLASTSDAAQTFVAFAGNDKLYLALKMRAANGTLQPGLVLWRER